MGLVSGKTNTNSRRRSGRKLPANITTTSCLRLQICPSTDGLSFQGAVQRTGRDLMPVSCSSTPQHVSRALPSPPIMLCRLAASWSCIARRNGFTIITGPIQVPQCQ
eukprot:764790-Hanusia_phi.AAC.4